MQGHIIVFGNEDRAYVQKYGVSKRKIKVK
jgi:hypothetical protein